MYEYMIILRFLISTTRDKCLKKLTELVLGDDRVVGSERIRASLKIFRAYSELVSRTFEQSRYRGVGVFRIDVRYRRDPTTTMGQITFLYYITTVKRTMLFFRFSSHSITNLRLCKYLLT